MTRPLTSGVVRWLKAEKRRVGRLGRGADLIDVLGLVSRASTVEGVGLGNDQHDRLALGDDAPDRVHR